MNSIELVVRRRIGGIAAFALWLSAACFPSMAMTQDHCLLYPRLCDCDDPFAQGLSDPWADNSRHSRRFSPFTMKYRVLAHPHGEKEELSLDTADSGSLRFETDGAESLPPVMVDNGAYPVQVKPRDLASDISAPVEIAKEDSTPPGDAVEAQGSKVQPGPPKEPHRAWLTCLRVGAERHPASQRGMEPSNQDRKDVTFSFTGTRHKAGSTKFRYKLDGLDSKWIETRQGSAYYPGLQDGDYRFEVQALNAAGLWSPPVGLSFSVVPPPLWQRYPFLIFVLAGAGIALMGSLYSAARARQLLQVERLRASIAANLHDQIGAGLTDIAILSEVAARKTGDVQELDRVAATARDLVDGMGDIVWLVNPRRDSLYELFVRLKDAYAELFVHAGAHLHVGDLSPFERARLSMAYRQDLHLLFQEALRNALRHSGCRRAELSVTLQGRHLEVLLRDDGQGFDPERQNSIGEGLETMKRRSKSLGGRLAIDSSPEGTVVRFTGKIPRQIRLSAWSPAHSGRSRGLLLTHWFEGLRTTPRNP